MQSEPISLFTSLKSSYGDKGSSLKMEKAGFVPDSALSDHRHQVWYNAKDQKVLVNVAGTHTKHDLLTDVKLGLGGFQALSTTKRAKDAKKALEAAREKYKPNKVVLAGHSLGGSIVQTIANPNTDTILALDSGFSPFDRQARKGKQPGSKILRAKGDVISMFGRGQQTIQKKHRNPFNAHQLKRIKKTKVYV